jgi:hypothetical protein
MIGLEAMTFLVLVATLLYLDVVPELTWRHVNYLWSPEDTATRRACSGKPGGPR